MSYYRECPRCGAHLDPGERCSCHNEEKKESKDHEEQNGTEDCGWTFSPEPVSDEEYRLIDEPKEEAQ